MNYDESFSWFILRYSFRILSEKNEIAFLIYTQVSKSLIGNYRIQQLLVLYKDLEYAK